MVVFSYFFKLEVYNIIYFLSSFYGNYKREEKHIYSVFHFFHQQLRNWEANVLCKQKIEKFVEVGCGKVVKITWNTWNVCSRKNR